MPPLFFASAQPRELIDTAAECLSKGQKIAMLTLVNIEGNAPYPVGSQMLVNERGEYWGQITGGCAEAALADQAVAAIRETQNITERYGLGSKYFDIQLPCGSGVDVHFDVNRSLSDYHAVRTSLQERKAVDQQIEFGGQRITKTYRPNERLLVFGQGPILVALCDLARLSGFDVISFVDQASADFSEYCDGYTALVSLFHEHELEIKILAAAVKTELFYIGALGSRRTHVQRLKSLLEEGVDNQLLGRIHGPVGMNIGAVSPAQIAVSILSEVIAVMNGNANISMHIHD